MYDLANASISVNLAMFGSFLNSSDIVSFHDVATFGWSVVEETGCCVVVSCLVSVGVGVVSTGEAGCSVICVCSDRVIFLFHYHFVAFVL